MGGRVGGGTRAANVATAAYLRCDIDGTLADQFGGGEVQREPVDGRAGLRHRLQFSGQARCAPEIRVCLARRIQAAAHRRPLAQRVPLLQFGIQYTR